MSNIRFIYLYRDADNYKSWGAVVFRNPDASTPDEVHTRMARAMMVDQTFIADQVRVPDVFLYRVGSATDADHCFHEFFSVQETDDPCDDSEDRSVTQFVLHVEEVGRCGWRGFDPRAEYGRRFTVHP